MRKGYGQYCPLALAAELLCERWTLLVVHRLIGGADRFNAIHRGVPRISASLLAQRLGQLEDAGLIERTVAPDGRGHIYRPTEACRELEPIIVDIATWGQRWSRDMVTDDLDPAFLVWSMHERMNSAAMPTRRTVIEFTFSGCPADLRRFWLVHEPGGCDMCLKHPGYDVDVTVSADIRRFVEAWRGIRNLRREVETGAIRVEGGRDLTRAFPDWFKLHQLAGVERRRPGAERVTMTAPLAAE